MNFAGAQLPKLQTLHALSPLTRSAVGLGLWVFWSLGFRGQVASLALSEGGVRESVEFQTSSGVQRV